VKEDDMSGACVTHGRDEPGIQNFGWGTLSAETTWKTTRIWEDNIIMNYRKINRLGICGLDSCGSG
jgi:hypothetical protein